MYTYIYGNRMSARAVEIERLNQNIYILLYVFVYVYEGKPQTMNYAVNTLFTILFLKESGMYYLNYSFIKDPKHLHLFQTLFLRVLNVPCITSKHEDTQVPVIVNPQSLLETKCLKLTHMWKLFPATKQPAYY